MFMAGKSTGIKTKPRKEILFNYSKTNKLRFRKLESF